MAIAAVFCAVIFIVAILLFDYDRRKSEVLLNLIEDRTLTRWIEIETDRGKDGPSPEEVYQEIHEWIYTRRHQIDQQGYEITCRELMDAFDDVCTVTVRHGGQHVGCTIRRQPWT